MVCIRRVSVAATHKHPDYNIGDSLRNEVNDLLRGLAGGLIFGMPLLYTMEVWHHGMSFSSAHCLGLLCFILFINFAFCYASGLRGNNEGHSIHKALADSITAIGLAILAAAAVLYLIGRLDFSSGLNGILGQVIVEACAISIGITYTNSKFPRNHHDKSEKKHKNADALDKGRMSAAEKQARHDFHNFAAAIAGALIFTLNIAPTEEVVQIASTLHSGSLLLLLCAEVGACYLILYAAEFKEKKVYKASPLQSPAAEVILTVSASLIVAGVLLLLIGEQQGITSVPLFVASVITLGFPAIVGGAAGRLVV